MEKRIVRIKIVSENISDTEKGGVHRKREGGDLEEEGRCRRWLMLNGMKEMVERRKLNDSPGEMHGGKKIKGS